ncbi:MAG: two-component regulator propeller domain-containing protein, partial [Bacteroidota bacterium]|nr:two-component regulator propeller domain-containing protein [Bacteroidota bacterium]
PVSLVLFSGQLTALASNGTVYRKSGNNWIQLLYDNQAQKLISDGNYLYICTSANCYMYDATWNQTRLSVPSYDVSYNDATTTLYIASGSQGLLPFRQKNGQFVKDASAIVPNGPSQVFAWNAFFKDGIYYSTPGARWGDRNHIDGDIMSFDGENWSVLKGRDSIPYKTGCQFKDILNLAIDPNDNGHFFLTSWGEGLYEFRDSTFYKLHNQYNSSLITVLPGPFCRVDGARFDHSGNLWVLNSTYGLYSGMSDTTLWALKPDGSWHGFYYANMPPAPTWGSILVTSLDQMWINSVRGISYGIFVVDQNGTPWNTADDKTRWFSSFPVEDNATLSPAAINCITEDKNGTIWIGTKEGPILATNPSNVFDTDFSFNRVLIPRNDGTGYGDYLLKDVWVTCITVDGANRKWIGTSENGLYLVSSDGLTTIHRFTTENSPLPSDHILSIAIHPETGEVFVGTSAGLVSYRSDAIEGKETYQAVRVFPNPVKPSYSGQITVTGLKENSTVKITDLSGNLLVSGISLGGQFCWNGLNKQGKRVASGVYLVFCSSEDGTEYQTCKFMVVN